MPRYVIERFFDRITDDDMLAASVRSDRIAAERFPEIVWEHSHVVVDDDGAIKTFCVYEAPDENHDPRARRCLRRALDHERLRARRRRDARRNSPPRVRGQRLALARQVDQHVREARERDRAPLRELTAALTSPSGRMASALVSSITAWPSAPFSSAQLAARSASSTAS